MLQGKSGSLATFVHLYTPLTALQYCKRKDRNHVPDLIDHISFSLRFTEKYINDVSDGLTFATLKVMN